MEECTYAVGSRFVDNHGVGSEENTRSDRTDEVFGVYLFRVLEETYFGEVRERVVTRATRIGRLRRTNGDGTVALRYALCVVGVTVPYEFFLVLVKGFTGLIEQIDRIGIEHFAVHAFDFLRCAVDMCHDDSVERGSVYELKPCHVEVSLG